MSAAEFSFWLDYRQRNGFPIGRLEGTTAIAGAAICQTRGARVKASDLLPRYGPRPNGDKLLVAYLSGLPRAVVTRVNHGE